MSGLSPASGSVGVLCPDNNPSLCCYSQLRAISVRLHLWTNADSLIPSIRKQHIFPLCFEWPKDRRDHKNLWFYFTKNILLLQLLLLIIIITTIIWTVYGIFCCQVVTCVQTTGMANAPCTALFIRCAASLAPAAQRHLSPYRTSQNGCGIYPERWDFHKLAKDAVVWASLLYSPYNSCFSLLRMGRNKGSSSGFCVRNIPQNVLCLIIRCILMTLLYTPAEATETTVTEQLSDYLAQRFRLKTIWQIE